MGTAKTATGAYIPQGVNQANMALVRVLCPAMSSTDTLDVSLPAGVDPTLIPVSYSVLDTASDPYVVEGDLTLTNHNVATGKTRFTAGDTVANTCILTILYVAGDN